MLELNNVQMKYIKFETHIQKVVKEGVFHKING